MRGFLTILIVLLLALVQTTLAADSTAYVNLRDFDTNTLIENAMIYVTINNQVSSYYLDRDQVLKMVILNGSDVVIKADLIANLINLGTFIY